MWSPGRCIPVTTLHLMLYFFVWAEVYTTGVTVRDGGRNLAGEVLRMMVVLCLSRVNDTDLEIVLGHVFQAVLQG